MGNNSVIQNLSYTTQPLNEAEKRGFSVSLLLNKSGDFFSPLLPHLQIDNYTICDMVIEEAMKATLYLLSIDNGQGEVCAHYLSFWE